MQVIVRGTSTKGITKRGPREELGLRVRIFNDRHLLDVYQKLKDELAERADIIGPIDMSRNLLRTWTLNRGVAYEEPVYVDTLPEQLIAMIGDNTSATVHEEYAAVGGSPLPSVLSDQAEQTLWYRLSCNFGATYLGWDEEDADLYVEALQPDDIDADYRNNNPREPTVIRRYRQWEISGEWKECLEVYDLTDKANPSYRIYDGDDNRTEELTGYNYDGDNYWWRYEDGTPFHPIVISGNPREIYRGASRVEGTLKLAVLYTHWGAGVRDSGHPQRHQVDLIFIGMSSDAETGKQGVQMGPETFASWTHKDPEKPGFFHQDAPGFDPEVIGRAVRGYEMGLLSPSGNPTNLEGTGGDPGETERRALDREIRKTLNGCRRHDGECLKRLAAIANRASEATEGMEPTGFPEVAPGALYLDEVKRDTTDDIQALALNGAQVSALLQIGLNVHDGILTEEAALATAVAAFPAIPIDVLASIMSGVVIPPEDHEETSEEDVDNGGRGTRREGTSGGTEEPASGETET
jgi:hypothetical protein